MAAYLSSNGRGWKGHRLWPSGSIGNVIGRDCYCSIEATQHHGRLFVALVGDTAIGRKGTALSLILMLFRRLRQCKQLNTSSGLSTGEGVVSAVRDAVTKIKDGVPKVTDEGVADKRLLIIEEEMSRVLRVMARPEKILSTVLRNVWDGGDLSVMTKSPMRATAPHISACTSPQSHRCLDDGQVQARTIPISRFLLAYRVRPRQYTGQKIPLCILRIHRPPPSRCVQKHAGGSIPRRRGTCGEWRPFRTRLAQLSDGRSNLRSSTIFG